MVAYVVFLSSLLFILVLDRLGVRVRVQQEHLSATRISVASSSMGFTRVLSGPKVIATIIVALFSGLRYGVGWDYFAYYDTIARGLATNIVLRGEYLNILLVNVARYVGIPQLYFAVNSALCIWLIARCLREYSSDYWCSLILFVCFPLFYLNSLSVVRMFTALGLTFFGFRYVVRKEPLKYTAFVLVASMFHQSALFALVLYFARSARLKTWKLIVLLAFLPILSSVLLRMIATYLPQYAVYTRVTDTREGTKAFWFFTFVGLVATLLRDRLVAGDQTANMYYNNLMVGLCVYLMFFAQGTLGHRLSLYGTIYSLLLIPKMISLLKARDRILVGGLLLALCVVMFFYTVLVGSATYIPYRFVFEPR